MAAAFCVTAASARGTSAKRARCARAVRRARSRRELIVGALAAALGARVVRAEQDAAFHTLGSGLVVQDLRVGTGAAPVAGCEVVVRWTGRLSARYGWPYQRDGAEDTFRIGRDNLITGFEEGVLGMREKGKRRLIIPEQLGYTTGTELPRPKDFGDRRRLESTVANPRRIAGAVVIDVELLKVRTPRR